MELSIIMSLTVDNRQGKFDCSLRGHTEADECQLHSLVALTDKGCDAAQTRATGRLFKHTARSRQ